MLRIRLHEALAHSGSGHVCLCRTGSGVGSASVVRQYDADDGVDGSRYEEGRLLRREAQGLYAGVRCNLRCRDRVASPDAGSRRS